MSSKIPTMEEIKKNIAAHNQRMEEAIELMKALGWIETPREKRNFEGRGVFDKDNLHVWGELSDGWRLMIETKEEKIYYWLEELRDVFAPDKWKFDKIIKKGGESKWKF